MAALTATDWTVTVQSDRIQAKTRMVYATIALPTTGTYPSAGVPVPTYDKFGFKRNLESLSIHGGGVTGNTGQRFMYDQANGTIRIFVATTGNELATTVSGAGTTAAEVLYVMARGW